MILYFAGMDTSAHACTMTMYNIVKHGNVEKIEHELDSVLGDVNEITNE